MKKDPFDIQLPADVVIGIAPMQPVRLSLVCTACSLTMEPRGQAPQVSASSLLSLRGNASAPEMHVLHMCPGCSKQVTTPHAYPLITMLSEEEYNAAVGGPLDTLQLMDETPHDKKVL